MPATHAHRQRNTLLACDQMNTVYRQLPVPASPNLAHTPHGFRSPATAPAPATGFNGQRLERYGAYLLGNGYRAYHPQLQRFCSPDSFSPFGAGGINAYAYCGMDPVNRHDPSGHAPWRIGAALLAGTGVLAGTAMVMASRDTGIQTAGIIIAGLSGMAMAAMISHATLKKPKTSTPGGSPNTLGSAVASGPGSFSSSGRSRSVRADSLTQFELDLEAWTIDAIHKKQGMARPGSTVSTAQGGQTPGQAPRTPNSSADPTPLERSSSDIRSTSSHDSQASEVRDIEAFLARMKSIR